MAVARRIRFDAQGVQFATSVALMLDDDEESMLVSMDYIDDVIETFGSVRDKAAGASGAYAEQIAVLLNTSIEALEEQKEHFAAHHRLLSRSNGTVALDKGRLAAAR